MAKQLKVFSLILVAALIMLLVACNLFDDCEDGQNPVSELPTDLEGCGQFTIDQSGTVGEMIGISYTGKYSKVSVLWGENDIPEDFKETSGNPIAYHIYSKSGYYNVNVTVYSPRGYSCKCQRWVTIADKNNPNPASISFSITGTPSYGKPTLNVNFTHTFTATDGATCQSIAWDFGDSATGQGMTTSHSYTNTGTYEVTATAIDSLQRIAKAYATITVDDNPTPPIPGNQSPTVTISADDTNHDVRGTTNFNATASDPDGTIVNYEWVLGGGASESGASKTNVSHEYFNTSGATYSVYCIVTDDDGATAQSNSISITVLANQAPTVVSEINGEPDGVIPEINVGDPVVIDMCSSTDPNAGDSIVSSRYSTSAGLNPLSGSGNKCIWNAVATGSGTQSVILHVTDSYGKESNAKKRDMIIKTAVPECTFTNATSSRIVVAYRLSGTLCDPYLTTSTYNGPGNGEVIGRGCPVTSGSKNFMTEGSGQYDVIWTMRANGTNCTASDRFTITTSLTNICGGADFNNDVGPIQVVPNTDHTFSITVSGSCTNTNRTWRYYVDGTERWRQVLDSVNAH